MRITEAERMLIGGELVESVSGNWSVSVNLATEGPIGRVPEASAEDASRNFAAKLAQC
jgi:acyl-CoA reductase-like NAD-dependent aldehyde dehydrogenase